MSDREERAAAAREAAALKAQAKAQRDEWIRRRLASGWTPQEVRLRLGFSRTVVEKAVGTPTTPR